MTFLIVALLAAQAVQYPPPYKVDTAPLGSFDQTYAPKATSDAEVSPAVRCVRQRAARSAAIDESARTLAAVIADRCSELEPAMAVAGGAVAQRMLSILEDLAYLLIVSARQGERG